MGNIAPQELQALKIIARELRGLSDEEIQEAIQQGIFEVIDYEHEG